MLDTIKSFAIVAVTALVLVLVISAVAGQSLAPQLLNVIR